MESSYTVVECKEKLGVGDDELKELVRSGRLHVFRQDNQIRIRAGDVERIMEEANAPPEAFREAAEPTGEPDVAEEPIALVTEQEMKEAEPGQHEIRSFGSQGGGVGRVAHDESRLTRALLEQGGATRCRVFHAKLNDGALSFMENQINEWTDAHPDIVIKFMSTAIGIFEGKHTEPHLIVTVFY